MSVFGMKHLRRLPLPPLVLLHLFAAVRSQVNPGLCSKPPEVTSAVGRWARSLQLSSALLLRKVATFRQEPEQGFGVIVKIVSDVGQ